jgi:hypothetical protein
VKPEFFRNEQLAELPFEDRLLFIGLWTQADKAGRLEDRPKRLKGELFPYDDLKIDDALGRLANAGLIVRYEGNGARLIAIPTWEKHQHLNAREPDSVLPPHMGGCASIPAPAEGKGTEWKGSGKEGNDHALRAAFDGLWSVYPRKVGKDAALAEFLKIRPDIALTADMVAAVRRQSDSPQWRKDGGQFIPHPRTWLKQGRCMDIESRPDRIRGPN